MDSEERSFRAIELSLGQKSLASRPAGDQPQVESKLNYLYLIKSKTKNWVYIGSARDLRKRIGEHNLGKNKSTKAYKPFELIYYEAYNSYTLARKREIELKKNGQQKEILFRRLGLE